MTDSFFFFNTLTRKPENVARVDFFEYFLNVSLFVYEDVLFVSNSLLSMPTGSQIRIQTAFCGEESSGKIQIHHLKHKTKLHAFLGKYSFHN